MATRPRKPTRRVMTARRRRAKASKPKSRTRASGARRPTSRRTVTRAKARRPRRATRSVRSKRPAFPPSLDRQRRVLIEEPEALTEAPIVAETVHAGDRLERQGSGLPGLTGGDLDANWEQAYLSGDEAPGGDNPTPDQDRVDDIGRALGVRYADEEELVSTDKIIQRDRHRWELDPASAEDYSERSKPAEEGEEEGEES